MPGLSEFSSGFGLDEITTKSGQRKAESEDAAIANAETMRAIAQELYGSTQPLRQTSIPQLQGFLSEGTIPGAVALKTPDTTAYARDVLERQFGRAREGIVSRSAAQGGRLASALNTLEGERALGVTGLYTTQAQRRADQENQLRQQLFGQALGLGWGQPPVALTGLAGSTTGYTNVAGLALQESLEKQKRAQDKAGTMGGFGIGMK